MLTPSENVQSDLSVVSGRATWVYTFVADRWLTTLRLLWLALVALAVSLWAIGSVENATVIPEACSEGTCDPFALSSGDLLALKELDLPVNSISGFFVASNISLALMFFAIAGIIAWRKSDDAMGLLVSFALVYLGAALFTDSDDALWRAYSAARPPLVFLGMVGYASIMLILFYFPDGHFVPGGRIARTVAWFVIFATTPLVGTATRVGAIGSIPMVATIGLGLAAQIYRYIRVSRPEQRQQTKWIVIGLATSLGAMMLWLFAATYFPPGPPSRGRAYFLLFIRPLITVLIPLLPITFAFSILRYRLWDVDVVINRTLVYGVLTAIVVGVYALVVGALGTLFQTGSNWLVALVATGLVAVLFQPLRDRLQSWLNHRLYGHRDEPFEVLAQLGQQLESTLSPETLYPRIVDTVARALRLPYAAIAVKQGEQLEIVESYGRRGDSEIVSFPIFHQGQTKGKLLVSHRAPGEEFSEADERLLRNVARQAGFALHNVRLTADLQLARRQLVTSREEERRRLRRDLHDGLAPTLAALSLQAGLLQGMIRQDPGAADSLLSEFRSDIRAAIDDIRRVAYDLRPPVLDQLGLAAAVRASAARYDSRGSEEGLLQVQVDAPEELGSLPAAVEVAAYRIVQEALTNVTSHAQADRCRVRLARNGYLEVEVVDNGIGMPPNPPAGVGLLSMRERAEELGGTTSIEPSLDGGTRVYARLPLQESQPL